MNVSIRHFRVFVAVADAGSFTGAANAVGLSQPAVTSIIRQLEDELATTLFTRTTRQVRLAEDGLVFLPIAKRLIDEFDNAINEMKADTDLGAFRISLAVLPTIAVLFLPQILETMIAETPQFNVHVRDLNSSAIHRRVRAGEVDLGLGVRWEDDQELAFKPLVIDRLGVVCGTGHTLASSDGAVAWEDATRSTFLNLATDTGIRPLIEAAGGLTETARNSIMEFSNVLTLASVLERNIGVTAMPYLTFLSLRSRGLCFRPLAGQAIERTICAVTRKASSQSPAVKKLLALLSEQIEQISLDADKAPYVRAV